MIIKGEDFYGKRDLLQIIKVDADNYITYFLDERTGSKWIEEYLFPEMHGGGPPQLRLIEKFPWE